ncbi:MAG: hypothetical protein IJ506_02890 [Clostridia bacterium]|nr:hypothetical protein [Clostridia bacterium]
MTKQRKAIVGCLCVGVIASACGVGLLSSHTATAENVAKFEMAKGASVRLAQTADDETGIRWQASFNKTYWDSLQIAEGQTVQFGAIVTAASNLTGVEDFTKDSDSEVVYVPCEATAPEWDENDEFTYYASIVYPESSFTEEELLAASAVELTARAYIKIGDDYRYVDEYAHTTRSMRAVALAEVHDETVDIEDVSAYCGTITQTAEENTGYYSDVDESASLTNPLGFTSTETYQAYIDAQPVELTVGDGLTVTGASGLKKEKTYMLDVFTADGKVYTQPLIAATKVIDEASDLSYFTMTNIELGTDENNMPYATEGTTEFDGYYVLTKNIDATDYTHKVTDRTKGDATMYADQTNANGVTRSKLNRLSMSSMSAWAVQNYVPSKCGGLTGTFDGNGYTISNLTVADHGLFGIIIGGTVKNLGLVNAQLGAALATYEHRVIFAEQMVDATVENVYLQMADDTISGSKAALAMTTAGSLTMNNCVFDFNIYGTDGADVTTVASNYWAYGLFGSTTSQTMSYADTTFTCSDVYVRSNVAISVTRAGNNYGINTSVSIAENDATADSNAIEKAAFELIGGTVGEDGSLTRNGATWTPTANKYIFNTWSGGSHIRRIEGMYRYDTATEMENAGNTYDAFDSELWETGEGKIAFRSTGKSLAHTVEGTYYMDGTTGTFTSEDKTKMFGNENAVITSATYNGQELTVENGAIKGFEDISTHGTKVELTVGIDGKELPYGVSVIPATKLISTKEDLAVFTMTNIELVKNSAQTDTAAANSSYATEGTTEFAGYYVLTQDIDATGYTHKVTNGGVLTDAVKSGDYSKLEIVTANGSYGANYARGAVSTHGGLTGTFDGNGHTISNLTVQNHGLFGLVIGGTIKNVGFVDVTIAAGDVANEDSALFAAQMVNGTMENVYVKAKEITGDATANLALLAISGLGTNTLKNCVFEYDFANRAARTMTYGLFASTDTGVNNHRGSVAGTNVYVISNSALCVRALGSVSNGTQVAIGTNETTETDKLRFELLGGVITVDGETTTYTLNGNAFTTSSDTSIMGTNHWWVGVFSGVDRYNKVEDMLADTANDYTALSAEYWTVTTGADGSVESVSWKGAN